MTPDELGLQPGDVLLYSGDGFFSTLIKLKTWSTVSHCEVYDGYSFSVASRDGKGVGRYPFREDGLIAVLRPIAPFDTFTAHTWFTTVDGQEYDWLGLLSFTSAKYQGQENGKMFCSEFATRYLRAGNVDPFAGYDADGIAPGEFLKSVALRTIWRKK